MNSYLKISNRLKAHWVLIILLTSLPVFLPAAEPAWTAAPNLQYNMQVVGRLQTAPGIFSISGNDMVAAFVNGQCRGVASPMPEAGGIIFLTIGSNVQSGEIISFKAYLHDANKVVDIDQGMTFASMGETGTFLEPYTFSFSSADIPVNLTLATHNVMAEQVFCFNALQTITLAGSGGLFVLWPDAVVTLIAGKNIDMLPGTHIHAGSRFSAKILPDGPFCDGSVKYIAQDPSIICNEAGQDNIADDANTHGDNVNQLSTGIERLSDGSTFASMYPNPTTGIVTVELLGISCLQEPVIELFGIKGEQVNADVTRLDQQSYSLNLTGQLPGLYFIRILQKELMFTGRIIIVP